MSTFITLNGLSKAAIYKHMIEESEEILVWLLTDLDGRKAYHKAIANASKNERCNTKAALLDIKLRKEIINRLIDDFGYDFSNEFAYFKGGLNEQDGT